MVGAGRFERPTPCAQDIGSPHLRINRFNNLRALLVGLCGNFSYNPDCKASIRPANPPTKPTGCPAGIAGCEINQRGAHMLLQQTVSPAAHRRAKSNQGGVSWVPTVCCPSVL